MPHSSHGSADATPEVRTLLAEQEQLLSENLGYMALLSRYTRFFGLFSTLSPESLAERLLESLRLETRAQGGVLWLAPVGAAGPLRLAAVQGLVKRADEQQTLAPDSLPPGLEPLLEAGSGAFLMTAPAASAAADSFLYLRIREAGRLLAVARVNDRLGASAFDASDLSAAEQFAELAALALGNALRFRALERGSLRDPRTQAFKPAFFEGVVASEIEKGHRFGRRFSLLEVELSGLSVVRERLGEPAAGRLADAFANQLQETLRGTDICAVDGESRYRLLLAETDALGAAALKRRLRVMLESLVPSDIRCASVPTLRLASATFPADGGRLEELTRCLARRLDEESRSLARDPRAGDPELRGRPAPPAAGGGPGAAASSRTGLPLRARRGPTARPRARPGLGLPGERASGGSDRRAVVAARAGGPSRDRAPGGRRAAGAGRHPGHLSALGQRRHARAVPRLPGRSARLRLPAGARQRWRTLLPLERSAPGGAPGVPAPARARGSVSGMSDDRLTLVGVALIADGDVDRGKAIAEACATRGLVTRFAAHGAEALEAALAEPPDVLVAAAGAAADRCPEARRHPADEPTNPGRAAAAGGRGAGRRRPGGPARDVAGRPGDGACRASRRCSSPTPARPAAPSDLPEERDLEGKLAQLGLPDLLQLFHMNRKTGTVELRRRGLGGGEERGLVAVSDGNVVDARCGAVEGEKALHRLLAWRTGSFAFTRTRPCGPARIHTPTRALLLEGMRQLDEVARIQAELPDLDAEMVLRVPASALPSASQPLTREVLRLIVDSPRVSDILDRSVHPDYQVLRTLQALVGTRAHRAAGGPEAATGRVVRTALLRSAAGTAARLGPS